MAPNGCNDTNGKWTFKREVNLPTVITFIFVLISAISAYYLHDNRISMLEFHQGFMQKQLEMQTQEIRKLDRLEASIMHLNQNVSEMRKAIDRLKEDRG